MPHPTVFCLALAIILQFHPAGWAGEPAKTPTVFTIVYDKDGNFREKGEPRSFYEPLGYKGFPGALKRKYINMNAVPAVVGHVGDIVRFTRMTRLESEWILDGVTQVPTPDGKKTRYLVVLFRVQNVWDMKLHFPVTQLTVSSLQNRKFQIFETLRFPPKLLPEGSKDVMDDPSVGPGITERFAALYELPTDVTQAEIRFPGLFPILLDGKMPMGWYMQLPIAGKP
jgi:hypothetical protein